MRFDIVLPCKVAPRPTESPYILLEKGSGRKTLLLDCRMNPRTTGINFCQKICSGFIILVLTEEN